MNYVPQDQLDDARNALGCGIPISTLAAQLGVTEGELRQLLGLPQWMTEQGDLFDGQPTAGHVSSK